ncbi:cation:proton antiporter [Nitratifractor sp.]
MDNTISIILTLSLLLWTSPFLAKFLRVPTPPVEIVLGSALAYLGILHENSYFDLIAEMGFLYLMFIAGMEVDLKQIIHSPRIILRKAAWFVMTLGALALLAGLLLQMNHIVIISLPLISIGLVASLSKIYGRKDPWLNLAILVGVMGEVASIATLTVLDAASTVGFGWELLFKILYLLLFLFAIYLGYRLLHLLFWWAPELKKKLMPSVDSSDQDVRLAIALFFIMISAMLALDLELALGAFIAGAAISAFFHHEKELESKLSSLGFGFLVPLFFIHVGSSFDLEALRYGGVVTGALTITAITILIRILAAFHLRKIYTRLDALMTAISLSMPLTLLIAVATIGFDSGAIDNLTYYTLILASLFEVIVAMLSIKALDQYRKHLRMKKRGTTNS